MRSWLRSIPLAALVVLLVLLVVSEPETAGGWPPFVPAVGQPERGPVVSQTGFSYVMQRDNPVYMQNWVNSLGCAWLGIAGQVFDLSGRPVVGLTVHVVGGGVDETDVTGAHLMYGPGGYELQLADHVMTTTNTYQLQVLSSGGQALSDWYAIPTFQDCSKNLILVNFISVLPVKIYLPLVRR